MAGLTFLLLAWKNGWGSKGLVDIEESPPILGGIEKDLGFPLEVMGRRTVHSSDAQQFMSSFGDQGKTFWITK